MNSNLKGQSCTFINLIACTVMLDLSISLAVVISSIGPVCGHTEKGWSKEKEELKKQGFINQNNQCHFLGTQG